MASSPKESKKVIEGIFAINKPQWQSSAGVLRDLQTHFNTSALFTPWLDSQRRNLVLSNARPKNIRNLQVKLGHGGTLDPLATGVLIVGVGRGTKTLQRFLECTKTYECVVLFGAATDSYDAVGKVVGKKPYGHVTRDMVEGALEGFRGKIMQRPSVFSALKVNGKKMYEYARAGGEIPEVQAREVEVRELEMVEWLHPGSHSFTWPKEEVDGVEKVGAEKLMGVRDPGDVGEDSLETRGIKRTRLEEADEDEDHITNSGSHPKKPKTDDEPAMSGALPIPDAQPEASVEAPNEAPQNQSITNLSLEPKPPAARLRMTVTSGFYVRSLCHDLGLALNTFGLMSSLIRTRQGDYSLKENVLEYSDLEAGPEVWEPKVQQHLEAFMEKEGWEQEAVIEDEEWREKLKELMKDRKEGDRDRSFQGGRKNWNGNGNKKGKGRNYYSKDMNGGGGGGGGGSGWKGKHGKNFRGGAFN
ncbi:tRNA pseudouridine synthase B [Lindgomyces ingoldianus]|uniref:tRNA pseudouridine synthase B n=1 Tax=Lindgomyces ingoldianus TaxID=673940 RepID=A0ACB6QPI8_9PLEO|nr:tRNA pseudouridine synthase B [Lindgomyces ingoldianus]KAF2468888.1 tRNA pseudouridine synthase B [Lindgomyces ingoldianus]